MSGTNETPPSGTPETPTTPESEANPNPTPEQSLAGGATTESKPEDTPPAPAFEPITAEALTFPEGFEVDEGLRDEFLGLVNNRELSETDRVKGLVGLWTKGLETAEAKGVEMFNAAQEAAQNEVKSDPELGGANLPTTLTSIGKLMEEFGTPELRTLLDTTGAGNSIHVVRFLHTLAGKLTEGSIQPQGSPPAAAESSAAARLFPSMKG